MQISNWILIVFSCEWLGQTMVLIKHLTIVLFQKTTEKQALISPVLGFFLIRPTRAYRRHICVASRIVCKYKIYCKRHHWPPKKFAKNQRAIEEKET